jgi:hypothetical protein
MAEVAMLGRGGIYIGLEEQHHQIESSFINGCLDSHVTL